MDAGKKYSYQAVSKSSFWHANWLTVRMILESKMVMLFFILSIAVDAPIITAWLITAYGYTKLAWIDEDFSNSWARLKRETKIILYSTMVINVIALWTLYYYSISSGEDSRGLMSIVGISLLLIIASIMLVTIFGHYLAEVYDDYNGSSTGIEAVLSDTNMIKTIVSILLTITIVLPIIFEVIDSSSLMILVVQPAIKTFLYLIIAGQLAYHLYSPEPPKVTVYKTAMQT